MSTTGNTSLLRVSAALLAAIPCSAHMVSISTGEIRLEGQRARYEFRMPLYEIQHVENPEKTLSGAIKFYSAGVEAQRRDYQCRRVDAENALICTATYEFAQPVDVLDATSRFHTLTVPNHVHLLRAVRGDFNDQAVLDLSFPKAQLRFRPPTFAEKAVQQMTAGALRAAGGMAQWLFFLALVLAARTRRELIALAAMFIAGEAASCLILPLTSWNPAPRFVEAACALTIAYLAVEILLLPAAGQRWLVVAVLGVFHGLYFSLFISSSEYEVGWVMLGVAIVELAVIAALAWLLSKLRQPLAALQPVRVASALLLITGLGWFFLRLRG